LQDSWKELTIEQQSGDPKSSLNLYRTALNLRAEHLVNTGELEWIESPVHGSKSSSLLGYRRGNVTVYMNLDASPVEIEIAGKVLMVSAGTPDGRGGKITIPAVSTLWVLH
jgi:alpha-glucosidase